MRLTLTAVCLSHSYLHGPFPKPLTPLLSLSISSLYRYLPHTVLSSPTSKNKLHLVLSVSLHLSFNPNPNQREAAMVSLSRPVSFFLLLFVGLLVLSPAIAKGSDLIPQATDRSILIEESRARRLTGSFHICALCTCCGGPRGICLPSPCCYAINCNIPNRPFGYCSFTPRTCNCFGCHL